MKVTILELERELIDSVNPLEHLRIMAEERRASSMMVRYGVRFIISMTPLDKITTGTTQHAMMLLADYAPSPVQEQERIFG